MPTFEELITRGLPMRKPDAPAPKPTPRAVNARLPQSIESRPPTPARAAVPAPLREPMITHVGEVFEHDGELYAIRRVLD